MMRLVIAGLSCKLLIGRVTDFTVQLGASAFTARWCKTNVVKQLATKAFEAFFLRHI